MEKLEFLVQELTQASTLEEKIKLLEKIAEFKYDAVDTLKVYLKDKNPQIRIKVLQLLFQIYPSNLSEILANLASDSNRNVRLEVVNLLSKIADDKAVELLIGFLNDEVLQVRVKAIESLGNLSDDRASEHIKRKIDEAKLDKEIIALMKAAINLYIDIDKEKLMEFWQKGIRFKQLVLDYIEQTENYVEILEELFEKEEDNNIKARIIQIIDKTFYSIDFSKLIKDIKNQHFKVREAIIRLLGKFASPQFLDLIDDLIKDEHYRVRQAIAEILPVYGEEVIDYLIVLLQEDITPIREKAAIGIAKIIGDEKYIEQIAKYLNDGSKIVRQNIVKALSNLAIPKVVPFLVKALDDGNPLVRQEACIGFKNVALEETVKYLEKAIQDESVNVRLQALEALEAIGTQEALELITFALKDREEKVREKAALILHKNGKTTFYSHLELGWMYLKKGWLDEAQEQIEKVLKIEPYNKDALLAAARIAFRKQNWDLAYKHYTALASTSKIDNLIKKEFAKVCEKTSRLNEAIILLKEVLNEDSSDEEAYLMLIQVYIALKQFDEAKMLLKKAKKVVSDREEIEKLNLQIQLYLGDKKQVEEKLMEFWRTNKDVKDASLLIQLWLTNDEQDKLYEFLISNEELLNELEDDLKLKIAEKLKHIGVDFVEKVLEKVDFVKKKEFLIKYYLEIYRWDRIVSLLKNAKLLEDKKLLVEAYLNLRQVDEVEKLLEQLPDDIDKKKFLVKYYYLKLQPERLFEELKKLPQQEQNYYGIYMIRVLMKLGFEKKASIFANSSFYKRIFNIWKGEINLEEISDVHEFEEFIITYLKNKDVEYSGIYKKLKYELDDFFKNDEISNLDFLHLFKCFEKILYLISAYKNDKKHEFNYYLKEVGLWILPIFEFNKLSKMVDDLTLFKLFAKRGSKLAKDFIVYFAKERELYEELAVYSDDINDRVVALYNLKRYQEIVELVNDIDSLNTIGRVHYYKALYKIGRFHELYEMLKKEKEEEFFEIRAETAEKLQNLDEAIKYYELSKNYRKVLQLNKQLNRYEEYFKWLIKLLELNLLTEEEKYNLKILLIAKKDWENLIKYFESEEVSIIARAILSNKDIDYSLIEDNQFNLIAKILDSIRKNDLETAEKFALQLKHPISNKYLAIINYKRNNHSKALALAQQWLDYFPLDKEIELLKATILKDTEKLMQLLNVYPEEASLALANIYQKDKKYDLAIKVLENAPKTLEVEKLKAIIYYRQGKYDKVVEILYKFKDDLEERDILKLLAKSLEAVSKVESAVDIWKKLLEEDPNDWESYEKLGDYYLKEEKLHLALNNYLKAYKIRPISILALKIAGVYRIRGEFLQAATFYKKGEDILSAVECYLQAGAETQAEELLAQNLSPTNPELVEMYIQILAKKFKWEEIKKLEDIATTSLSKALVALAHIEAGDPEKALSLLRGVEETVEVLFLRGRALYCLGDLAEAKDIFLSILDEAENKDEIYYYLALIEERKNNYGLAYEYLKKALEFTQMEIIYVEMVKVLAKLGKWDEALKVLKIVEDLVDDYIKAEIYFNNGYYEEFLKYADEHYDWKKLFEAYKKIGKLNEAKNVLKLNINDNEAKLEFAKLLLEEGNIDQALMLLEQLPKTNEVIFLQAKIYYEKEEYSKALMNLKQLLNAGIEGVYYLIGKIASKRSDLMEALKWFRKEIEKNPSFIEAYKEIGIILKDENPKVAVEHFKKYLLKREDEEISKIYLNLILELDEEIDEFVLELLEKISDKDLKARFYFKIGEYDKALEFALDKKLKAKILSKLEEYQELSRILLEDSDEFREEVDLVYEVILKTANRELFEKYIDLLKQSLEKEKLAKLYLLFGENSKLIKLLEENLELLDKDISLLKKYCEHLYKIGEYRKIINLLEEKRENLKDDEILNYLVKSYINTGLYLKAAKLLEELPESEVNLKLLLEIYEKINDNKKLSLLNKRLYELTGEIKYILKWADTVSTTLAIQKLEEIYKENPQENLRIKLLELNLKSGDLKSASKYVEVRENEWYYLYKAFIEVPVDFEIPIFFDSEENVAIELLKIIRNIKTLPAKALEDLKEKFVDWKVDKFIGLAYEELEYYQEAEKRYKAWLVVDEIQALKLLANLYEKWDKLSDLIYVYRKLIDINPDKESRLKLAIAYAKQERYDDAIEMLDRAGEEDDVEILRKKIEIYKLANRKIEAAGLIRQILEHERDKKLVLELVDLYEEIDLYEEAVALLKKVTEEEPDVDYYKRWIKLLYDHEFYNEALMLIRDLEDKFNQSGEDIKILKAKILIELNRLDEAEVILEELDENNIEVLKLKALYYEKSGVLAQSLDYYFKILSRDENNFEINVKVAKILRRRGILDDAIEYFNKSLQIKDDLEVRLELAQTLLDKGLEDEASEELIYIMNKAEPDSDILERARQLLAQSQRKYWN